MRFAELGMRRLSRAHARRALAGSVPLVFSDLLAARHGRRRWRTAWSWGSRRVREFRTATTLGRGRHVAPYLHDGRADTLDEAIRFARRGGERTSRAAYEALDARGASRRSIEFLTSLGGRSPKCELGWPASPRTPPIAPRLARDGGPTEALDGAALEAMSPSGSRPLRSRRGDQKAASGRSFNGDSHAAPVISTPRRRWRRAPRRERHAHGQAIGDATGTFPWPTCRRDDGHRFERHHLRDTSDRTQRRHCLRAATDPSGTSASACIDSHPRGRHSSSQRRSRGRRRRWDRWPGAPGARATAASAASAGRRRRAVGPRSSSATA
jgi:hypothetical protein